MDAIKFIEERKRLCSTYSGCTKCPVFRDNDTCLFSATNGGTPDEQVKILSVWVADHPRKTRQSVFLEQYPNAIVNAKGTVEIWPCNVEKNMQNVIYCNSLSCSDCRREFWMQEVE